MRPSHENDRSELSLDALEYLLGDARGEDAPFEQRLLYDPEACQCLMDLVLVQQAVATVLDCDASVLPLHASQPKARSLSGSVAMLTGLAAMLLVGLWIGYRWGDRQNDGSRSQDIANNTAHRGSSSGDSSIVWDSDLIGAWTDLSLSSVEGDASSTDDELDAAYDAASPTEWSAEAAVPDWMWTAVSISAMDEAPELRNEEDFEFEETL